MSDLAQSKAKSRVDPASAQDPVDDPAEAKTGMTERAKARSAVRPSAPRWVWALLGVAAGLVAVGAAQLAAVVVGPATAPLVAVGNAFVDHTPVWLKVWATQVFGTADKAVLLGGAATVLALAAAGCGLIARRTVVLGSLAVLALVAVAAVAAVTRPEATLVAGVPSLTGGVVGVAVLALLAWRTKTVAARSASRALRRGSDGGASRRSVLVAPLAASGAGVALGAGGWALGRSATGTLDVQRASVQLPAAASPAKLPAGVDVGVAGVAPFRVPNEDFYRIDTALVVPRVDARTWSLRIHGSVEREVTLTFAQLLQGALVERDVTLCCVSNEVGGDLVGNARWLGLPIGPLLRQAGPTPDANMVLSRSVDGWTASTPLQALTDGRAAMLAIGMNGQPLPVEHGYPVRMVVPGLYGYVSATKWVVDLEVTRFDLKQGYWTPRGWSPLGPVKTQSRIDVPRDGATVKAGRVAVAGVAWAQHRGVSAVQVSVDNGAWQPARLGADASVDAWREWVFAWDATPGDHTLRVRATDRTGAVQTGQVAAALPDGATGWHTVQVHVTA